MTTPQELQTVPAFLMHAMQNDVRISLANTAAWLDPLRLLEPGLIEEAYFDGAYEEDPDALAMYALSVARRCFPSVYCELVEGLRAGWDFRQIESAFCAGLRRAYPHLELEALYDMVYGVPLPFVGLDVTSPEFLDDHPDYAALLADTFDLHPVSTPATRWRNPYAVINENNFDAQQPIARHVIKSLIAQDCQPCADLAFLLMFLFSCTGNSLLDFSANAYWEVGFEPLDWEPDALSMTDEACREMTIVLYAVGRSMQRLAEDDALSSALKTNIAALKAAERIENVALNWPDGHRSGSLEPGAPGETGPDSCLLFLRHCYAETD
ncbi:MAG: hypothetical protein JXJ17_12025 [Anaerolineae bacterium]|nr:hypothetical protein [Anaerolineae bacterium]